MKKQTEIQRMTTRNDAVGEKYCIPRNYAALYLQWWWGTKRTVQMLKTLPRDSRGATISFQEGKLGRAFTGGGGCC